MSLVSLEHVQKIATKHGCGYWIIKDSNGNLLDTHEGTDIAESMTLLEESYNGIKGETLFIRISPRKLGKGQDNQTKVFDFEVRCKTFAAPVGELPTATGGNSEIYGMITQLRVELAEQKKQKEIDDLKRQLDELKKEGKNGKHSRLDKLLDVVLLEATKTTNNKPVTPIAAPVKHSEEINGTTTPAQIPVDDKQRLAQVLRNLNKLDANFIDSLEKLQHFAEQNPEQYKQYLNML